MSAKREKGSSNFHRINILMRMPSPVATSSSWLAEYSSCPTAEVSE